MLKSFLVLWKSNVQKKHKVLIRVLLYIIKLSIVGDMLVIFEHQSRLIQAAGDDKEARFLRMGLARGRKRVIRPNKDSTKKHLANKSYLRDEMYVRSD